MKIHGFRSACSCLYSKGRCGWRWLPQLSVSNSQPHSRWLHHLQTHNGNAGRNSKRLQRSSGKHLVVRTKEIVPGSFFCGGESHPRSNLEYFRKKNRSLFGRNYSGACGCNGDLTGNQAPRHRKVNERGGFVPLQIFILLVFWILKIAQHNSMLGKNHIFWFMSQASACLLVRYCGDVVIWQPQSTAGPRRPGWKWLQETMARIF